MKKSVLKPSLVIASLVFCASIFAECPSPSNSVLQSGYQCMCGGEYWEADIYSCQGYGTGCDPLRNRVPCSNCWVFSSGSCTYGASITKHAKLELADADLSAFHRASSPKKTVCPREEAFQHWLTENLSSREERQAGGSQ